MKVLLTGYSGFLGSNIAVQLLKAGIEVRAMIRGSMPGETVSGVEYIQADVADEASIIRAVNNCDAVIHAAAMVKIWDKDSSQFMRVNYTGTKNLLKACEAVGVNRFVYVSSAGVLGPTTEIPATETYKSTVDLSCHYVQSKQLAGNEVLLAGCNGMFVNVVYPSRMYGPGPLNHANSITGMINDFRKGNWHFTPPYGNVTGSYNHVEAVAEGVVNALLKGKSGEQYLLGGENLSYDSFFNELRNVTGRRQRLFTAPYPLLYGFSMLLEQYARLNGNYSVTMNSLQVKRFKYHYSFDSSKAVHDLDYRIIPFKTGLTETVDWLKGIKN